jgi:hypothetical protein
MIFLPFLYCTKIGKELQLEKKNSEEEEKSSEYIEDL